MIFFPFYFTSIWIIYRCFIYTSDCPFRLPNPFIYLLFQFPSHRSATHSSSLQVVASGMFLLLSGLRRFAWGVAGRRVELTYNEWYHSMSTNLQIRKQRVAHNSCFALKITKQCANSAFSPDQSVLNFCSTAIHGRSTAFATSLPRAVYESSFWTSMRAHETSHSHYSIVLIFFIRALNVLRCV